MGYRARGCAAPRNDDIEFRPVAIRYCETESWSPMMSERVWDKFLTERDRVVFAAGGFGARAGFGKRPALLIIDVNWAFCGERPEPILESIKRWRTSCGEEAWAAVAYTKPLIESAPTKGLPGIYTTREARPDNT